MAKNTQSRLSDLSQSGDERPKETAHISVEIGKRWSGTWEASLNLTVVHLPEFVNRASVLIGIDMTLWVSLQTALVLCKYSSSVVKAHYTQGNYSPSKQTDV